jgi:hypothetical protein
MQFIKTKANLLQGLATFANFGYTLFMPFSLVAPK